MEFKEITDKQTYLQDHYPFIPKPKLSDIKCCMHCNENFTVGDYKVQLEYNFYTEKIEEYIVCPNAPKCDGTLIDWTNAKRERNNLKNKSK
jgi:hypothetical protein